MNILKIITLIIITLFLVACQGTNNPGNQQNFRQGYQGLTIQTITNQPPQTIYQNSDFRITVKLDNQGAYDLEEGTVSLLGFIDNYVRVIGTNDDNNQKQDITSLSGETSLKGKSNLYPSGDFTFIEFDAKSKQLTPGMERKDAQYRITENINTKLNLVKQSVSTLTSMTPMIPAVKFNLRYLFPDKVLLLP